MPDTGVCLSRGSVILITEPQRGCCLPWQSGTSGESGTHLMNRITSRLLSTAAVGLVAASIVAIAPAAQAVEPSGELVGTWVEHEVTAKIVDNTFKVRPGSSYTFDIVITNSGAETETVDIDQRFITPGRATVTDPGSLVQGASGLTGQVTVGAGETVKVPVTVKAYSGIGHLVNHVRIQSSDNTNSWLAWDTNIITNL